MDTMAVATMSKAITCNAYERDFLMERNQSLGFGQRSNTKQWSVITMGLLKAIVGGTVGLVVGTMTCQPISGMVGGAFIAQDWGK
jgi:hypothetical protein